MGATSTGAHGPPAPPAAGPSSPEAIEAGPQPSEVDDGDDDLDQGDTASSTASVSESILQYRTIQGRTFHSERHNTEYFTPNDNQQGESVDITHHYLTLLLGGKLYLAPIREDVQKVVDIGTGTGIWAIDFADAHPSADIVGTDLSPMQPAWVPPNLKFEIDDATQPWTWADGTFDFVHMRYLSGAIADWPALFRQAYRCCRPGGWVESGEVDVEFLSDDGTTDDPVLETWSTVFREGGLGFGRSFTVVKDDLQSKGVLEAGFVDVEVKDFKLPIGPWPADANLSETGSYVQLTMENDIEGYTLFLWNSILKWPADEYQLFLASMRKAIRNKRTHGYMKVRYVYGRKPEAS